MSVRSWSTWICQRNEFANVVSGVRTAATHHTIVATHWKAPILSPSIFPDFTESVGCVESWMVSAWRDVDSICWPPVLDYWAS